MRKRFNIRSIVKRSRFEGKRWKRPLIYGSLGLLVIFFLVQIFYPSSLLLPFESIDGKSFSMVDKSKAADELDDEYKNHKIHIYLGKSKKVYAEPRLKDIGITPQNEERLRGINYPWYLRIVPSSILWGHFTVADGKVEVRYGDKLDKYIDEKIMPTCREEPKNASLKSVDGKIEIVPAEPGGKCEKPQVDKAMRSVSPSIKNGTTVRTPLVEVPPKIDDKLASDYGVTLTERIGDGIVVSVANEAIKIPAGEAINWLEFSIKDDAITPSLSVEKSSDFMAKNISPKVAREPGVTKIVTQDFTEISRTEGPNGQALDHDKTLQDVLNYITSQANEVAAHVKPVPARQEFIRNYSPTDAGLSALLENYAKDHKGRFGVSLIELSGNRRRANYNGDSQFVTASTYKLFVAYSTLR